MSGQSCGEQMWEFFVQKVDAYIRSCNIQEGDKNDCFRECLPEDVQFIVHSTYGQDVSKQNLATLKANVKALVVMAKSRVASVVEMKAIRQQPEEKAEIFLSRLQSAGRRIGFKKKKACTCLLEVEIDYTEDIVRDEFIAGLADDEIRSELMKEDVKTIDEALRITMAHEMAKRSQKLLALPESAGKLSAYKQNKRLKNVEKGSEKKESGCHGCGNEDHGDSYADRKEKCPAWGKISCPCNTPNHFKRVCRKKGVPASAIDTDQEKTNAVWINETKLQVKRKNRLEIDMVSFNKETGKWTSTLPPKDDLPVEMVVDQKSYKALASRRQRVGGMRNFKTHGEEGTADTGATVTCGGDHLLKGLGINQSDLIPASTTLRAANGNQIPLIGTIPVSISMRKDGKKVGEPQLELLYISPKLGKVLLSKTLLKNFGSIPRSFPYPPNVQQSRAHAVNEENELAPCGCPTRTPAPLPPPLPCAPTEENIPVLEKHLMQIFESSTFNTCIHQQLPLMDGPELEISTKDNVEPTKVRVPATIPVHWRAKVKKGLDKDVELGVLEWVPMNTPETWCSRMVVTPKHNGDPRRTVDLQGLNDASKRQTHHTAPPFRQATSVHGNSYMTVTDAYEGFHSVPIRATDRHKTTFITPWGRLRYKTAPQGYLASGDAYTHRFDKITENVDNVIRNTDDSLLYEPTIEDNYRATASYLSLLGKHGILQNKDKFQFCSKVVKWSGFIIGNNKVSPDPEMTEAIRTFPTPENVTDLRSVYALCNQVAVYYAVSPQLEPFRQLLKKNTKWYWDEVLDGLFKTMRTVIADEVEKGVRLFDPSRKTAILTDWCKAGIGFVLTQKHCTCLSTSLTCCIGGWKVTLVGSRFNSSAEMNFSPTEGELLAVQDGLHKTRYFTLGCEDLIVGTDHKPLLGILCNKSMDQIDNPRILRLKEKTLFWRFKVVYVPGRQNGGPDCLSRRGLGGSKGTESAITDTLHTQEILEIDTSSDHLPEMTTKDIRLNIHMALLSNVNCCQVTCIDDEEFIIAAVSRDMKPVTWDEIAEESAKDPDITTTIDILNGASIPETELASETSRLLSFATDLDIENGVLLFRGRPVIPVNLRKRVLSILHAAHQGVSKMCSRAESSVFWPGITHEIKNTRMACHSCDRYAPSQPKLPPADPISLEYPFQHLSADHLDFGGYSYGIIVDRFSNWLKIYRGQGGASTFVKVLRQLCDDFNVPESITTDGGPHYTAHDTLQFFEQYGIRHRLTSVANPHANARAEIGVKSAKRILRSNIGMNGSIDNVAMSRALMVHRNTPDPETGLSPAELLLGRKLKGFLPNKRYKDPLSSSSDLSANWKRIAEWRELALAKRAARDKEKWTRGSRELPPLCMGQRVAVQNQSGNQPTRWDRRGIVVEILPHHQYKIKLDGSNRTTLRNRKYIRPYAAMFQDIQASPQQNLPKAVPQQNLPKIAPQPNLPEMAPQPNLPEIAPQQILPEAGSHVPPTPMRQSPPRSPRQQSFQQLQSPTRQNIPPIPRFEEIENDSPPESDHHNSSSEGQSRLKTGLAPFNNPGIKEHPEQWINRPSLRSGKPRE